MYEENRSNIELSEMCWDDLEIIRDVSYTNAFTFFWTEQFKHIQEGIRKIIPDIKGDFFRFKGEGKTITFSISDEAIQNYKPKIQEFVFFGSAVKMLGIYENYIRKIVEISTSECPDEIEKFLRNRNIKFKNLNNSVIKHDFGRGIDFLFEIFGFTPHPSYRPCLQFFFEFRNITVHNSGIIDERLIDAANNEYIIITGDLIKGEILNWNLSFSLQLQHLLITILSEVDSYLYPILKLPVVEKKPYWYLEE